MLFYSLRVVDLMLEPVIINQSEEIAVHAYVPV